MIDVPGSPSGSFATAERKAVHAPSNRFHERLTVSSIRSPLTR